MTKRIIGAIVFVMLIFGGGLLVLRGFKNASSGNQTQYRLYTVKTDLVKKTVTATGVLTPWQTVDIKSRAGGRVLKLAVEDGTLVKKGDLIALIDPSDTLLTYNSAVADIDANRARVDETNKNLALQKQQTTLGEQTAVASLDAARATANASKARFESAKNQSGAQKALSESAVENAEATLLAEKEKLNQMVNASHPQENASSLASLHEAEANARNALAQLNRQKVLIAKGFVAQSQVDQAQATYDVAQASVETAKAKTDTLQPELDADLKSETARVHQLEAVLKTAKANLVEISLKQQDAAAAYAEYQQSLAAIKEAEAKVAQARADGINNAIREAQIAQAKASGAGAKAKLANAKIQLDDTRVTAPSDGIILKKYVEQGTFITSGISLTTAGASIVQMGDISRMYVDVQVDETDVASVDPGQKVDITFDAYPTTPFEGKVIKVEPQATVDQNVTTVHVRVEVDNSTPSYRLLKPGMNSTCEFIVDRKEDVISVPNEALKQDSDGNRYFDVAQGGKPAPAEKDAEADPNLFVGIKIVKKILSSDDIGLEGNDNTEIKSGISAGDRVVTQTIEASTSTPATGGGFRSSGPGPGRR